MPLPRAHSRSYIKPWGVYCKDFAKYYSYALSMLCVYDSFGSVTYKLSKVYAMSVGEEEPRL